MAGCQGKALQEIDECIKYFMGSGGKMKAVAKKKKRERATPQELQKMWASVDLPNFWAEVAQKVSKDADAYERARAKSREGAAHQVLL